MLAKKDLSEGWFCLVCGQQGSVEGPIWLGPKRDSRCFGVLCVRTKGLGFRLQHEPFSPHKFPFFLPLLVGGETLSPMGLEDLQTDNGVQTALKNITSLEQPQG